MIRRFSVPCLAAFFLLAVSLRAEEMTSLTIGPDATLVEEWRTIPLQRGEQEIALNGIPAEAEISSLQLRLKRRDLPVISWRAAVNPSETVFALRNGNAVWTRGAAEEPAVRSRTVYCLVDSPSSGKQEVQLVYLVTNIAWSACYQAAVRGEIADDQPVSVDLLSRITIENGTSLSFDRARLYLAGPGGPSAPSAKPPGFLILNEESPLSELWKPPAPRLEPQSVYAVSEPVRFVPGRSDISFLTTDRLPALPMYRMTSEAVPVSGRRRGWPLDLILVLENRRSSGLGVLLPPGPVDIHRGNLWGPLIARGQLPHTPVDGEIRINLGRSEDVLGWRRDLGRARADTDAWYLDYEVEIQNLRKSSVTVEVDEAPPVVLAWELFSSTEDCIRRGGRLRFRQEIPGESRRRIEYRLHVREAEL